MSSELNGARFASVDVILPRSWAGTECALGRNVSTSSRYPDNFDGADFVINGAADPVRGAVYAEQFGGCGVAGNGGVKVAADVLTKNQNVSSVDGKCFF